MAVMDPTLIPIVLAVVSPTVVTIVWAIRLEGRVHKGEALQTRLEADVTYIRNRIDQALFRDVAHDGDEE
jgi:hypothetical protein